MARRPYRGSVQRERSDRVPVWIGGRIAGSAAAGNSSTLLSTLNAAALALRPFTIIRTHIVLDITSDQLAAGETVVGAYGEIVVKETAATAGIASVPTPITEIGAGFHVYQGLIHDFLFGDVTGFQARASTQYLIDSKAMRKVSINEDLAAVIQLGSAPGALVTVEGRILVKLH